MKKVNRVTQGYKKLSFLLEQLRKNKDFLNELKRARKEKNARIITDLLERYGIPHNPETDPFDPFLSYFFDGNITKPNPYFFDMCQMIDELKTALFQEYIVVPNIGNREDTAQYILESQRKWKDMEKDFKNYGYKKIYPVSIHINCYASKRDVLDFINKRWPDIEFMLGEYKRNRPKIRIRKNAKRDDFIWKNRKLPLKEIVSKLSDKLGVILDEGNIGKILSLERKRRGEK